MRRLAALLVLPLLLAACAGPTELRTDLLVATARDGVVTLRNRTDQPVYYLLATQDFLTLYDPAPCLDPAGCNPSVPANGAVQVPYAEIRGYAAGTRDAVVLHWPRTASASGVDGVRRITLVLR